MKRLRRRSVITFCAAAALGLPAGTTAQEPTGGPYTAAQATGGAAVYGGRCATCHGPNLDAAGVPPLSGPAFAAAWGRADRSLGDLFYVLRTTMPPGRTADLREEEHLAVLAYILQRNGVPPGDAPLAAAGLDGQRFVPPARAAAPARGPAPAFIAGPRGLKPRGVGPSHGDLLGAADNPNDWLFHTHDYTGRRYVARSQIHRGNVAALRPVCAYQLADLGNFQTGPIVHQGVMYLTTAHLTVAIDAATCRPRWKHVWEVQDRDVWTNNRGVAVKDGRVVRATSDGYLFALDAADGTLLWARHAAYADSGETFTMAPLIYDDLILLGPAGSENAIKGWIGAFRALAW
ncbi:MAG: PQQ-binding-like beta-propeller repeat protein [Gemmatimonadota bacterium]|nr:PQQ-binding-like beta-propeller repeat protein [Gemmatimonadota bacterium]